MLYVVLAGGLGGLITRSLRVEAEWFQFATTVTLAALFISAAHATAGRSGPAFLPAT